MNQLDLNFQHRARRRDPLTSHAAAAGSSHNPTSYARIMETLKAVGYRGATCYEIAHLSGLSHIEVARRMRELARRNYAEDTLTTRPGDSGYLCTVWRATA